MTKKDKLSVANEIKALALINIKDIFRFTITAKDDEIIERYGSEESAVAVAKKYMDIAMTVDALEYPIRGWHMEYTMPLVGSDKRMTYKANFYDVCAVRGEEDDEP